MRPNVGNVFPATDFKGNRQLTNPACNTARASARAVMHVGIPNPWWRMRNPYFYVSGKMPIRGELQLGPLRV